MSDHPQITCRRYIDSMIMEHDYYNLMLINKEVIADMRSWGWVPYMMGEYAIELQHYWNMMDEIILCGLSNDLSANVYDYDWYTNHFTASKSVIDEYVEMLSYQWIFQTLLIIVAIIFPGFGPIAALITYLIVYFDHAETTADAMMQVTKTLLGVSKLAFDGPRGSMT